MDTVTFSPNRLVYNYTFMFLQLYKHLKHNKTDQLQFWTIFVVNNKNGGFLEIEQMRHRSETPEVNFGNFRISDS